MKITCNCGEKKCTTTLTVSENSTGVDLSLDHDNSLPNNHMDIYLDPNNIVNLIKELKSALQNII